MSDAREQRRLTLAMWAAMAVAVVVRTAFLADKPLWRDEAWVALVAADPLGAVADGRAAPLGFLLLTRLVAGLGIGPAEVSYRLIPLVCGLAVVPLLARWASALGASRRTAVAATWIGVGLQPFVYYSRELKSYDIDLLVAVLVPLLGVLGFAAPDPRARTRWAFLACVAAAPWVSFGGVFAVCAVFSWGWLVWWPASDPAARRHWLACTLAFAASFAAAYVLALGAQANDSWMQAYWRHALDSDRRFSLPRQVAVATWHYVSVSSRYFFREWWPAVLAVAAIGAWKWPRPQRAFLVFLFAATAAFCVAAAVMDRYLLVHGRHLLFAAPILVLWSANGLAELGRFLGPRLGPVFALGIPVGLSLWWSVQSIHYRLGEYHTRQAHFFRYDVLHDVDRMIESAARLVPANERLLVSRKCAYAFQFYNDGRLPDAHYCERTCANFEGIARKWLDGIEKSAWVMISDEEVRRFPLLLDYAGFGYRERASERGVRLWEVERKPEGPRRREPRTTIMPGAPPPMTRPQ